MNVLNEPRKVVLSLEQKPMIVKVDEKLPEIIGNNYF
jgi:hypothetical protein